jgi:hypothetical protein
MITLRALAEHRRQERAIQPDSRKQVKVERAMPFAIVEHREAARRRRRSADDMDDDVDAPEAIAYCIGHNRASFGGGDISCHEQIVGKVAGPRAGGGEDRRTGLAQPRGHRFADPLGAARDEGPAAIQFEIVTHPRISSEAILFRSSPKTNSRLTGLPGKFPATRLVTTVLPSF